MTAVPVLEGVWWRMVVAVGVSFRGRRLRLVAIVSVFGAVGLAGATRSDAGVPGVTSALPGDAPVLTVERATSGAAVPAGFLGLSFEYWAVEAYAGQNPRAINPVLVRLIRNLVPGRAPVLRVGGETTDRTWWPVAGRRRPPEVNYTLSQRRLAVIKQLASAVGGRLILGINLEADSPTLAAAEARAQLAAIGRSRIQAFELGNEPELYPRHRYRTKVGREVSGRPAGYDFAAFTQDFARVRAAMPSVPLAGPASGSVAWPSSLGELIAAEPQLRLVTVHRYPQQACFFPPGPRSYPTIKQVLSSSDSRGLAQSVVPLVGVAHAHHLPLRIDEMGTIACGAARGVSGTFATALWALDALFSDVQVGVDGVNIHTYPGFNTQPFTFSHVNSKWQAVVEPQYYGLLMFAQAAPAGSRLLQLSGTSGTIRAWATRAPDGRIRVLLINDDTTRSQSLSTRVPAAQGAATLERLTAPSVHATQGVTLAGQSFGPQTDTGLLTGPRRTILLAPVAGAYTVRLPAASAAMLTLR
jgi:hypothetical protein